MLQFCMILFDILIHSEVALRIHVGEFFYSKIVICQSLWVIKWAALSIETQEDLLQIKCCCKYMVIFPTSLFACFFDKPYLIFITKVVLLRIFLTQPILERLKLEIITK